MICLLMIVRTAGSTLLPVAGDDVPEPLSGIISVGGVSPLFRALAGLSRLSTAWSNPSNILLFVARFSHSGRIVYLNIVES